jgi:uncharacterized protein (TIGR03067 family)
MRSILFIALIILGLSCGSTKYAIMPPKKLNGTWIPVSQELGGKPLPKAMFGNEKLILRDSTYTLTAGGVDKGILKCSDNKMDIFGKEGVNAGKHFTAIYKYENGQLIICYNLKGDSYPEAFETKAGQLLFLSVYKKE